ncbi:hypothetical protein NQ318_022480 [Aromia moschata]|uniref:HTH psq-type domain-containing protein n=1 Tax=Aromia moschata TaxID=1265417 RepID=A0AAV8Z5E5_9CUCU|nr:hypothetical protein NQ318_022480 [Aromia moschata]
MGVGWGALTNLCGTGGGAAEKGRRRLPFATEKTESHDIRNELEKLQVIEYLKNGMKNKDLSEKYKVHHSAISKIIHNKDKILQHKETMEK